MSKIEEKLFQDRYRVDAESAPDPQVKRMAEAFAGEEAEHVARLEVWRSRPAKS